MNNFGRISLFDSGADSVYHGGFLQLSKRFSNHVQLQTSYTWSKVIDSRPDFTSVVVGTDDSKNPQYTTSPNLDRGRGNADIRHRFVFSGLWQIDYAKKLSSPVMRALLSGYELSTIAQVQSGRPYSATVGGDPNNDGNTATDRVPYVGRNTIDGPGYASVDMRFSRDIPVFERAKLAVDVRGVQPDESGQLQQHSDDGVQLRGGDASILAGVGVPDADGDVGPADPAAGGEVHVLGGRASEASPLPKPGV